MPKPVHEEKGAAMVELAAAVPFLVLFLMLLVEVCVVMFDQLAVTQAAREGARVAAVNSQPSAAVAAAAQATRLNSDDLTISVGPRPVGGLVRVTVSYRAKIALPLVGTTLMRPVVSDSAAMSVEAAPIVR